MIDDGNVGLDYEYDASDPYDEGRLDRSPIWRGLGSPMPNLRRPKDADLAHSPRAFLKILV